MKEIRQTWLLAILVLLLGSGLAEAQTKMSASASVQPNVAAGPSAALEPGSIKQATSAAPTASVSASTDSVVQNSATKSPVNLIDAANQYKANSKELLSLQESEVNQATAKLDELRKLVEEGLVARAELEAAEQQLAGLREQVLATQKQIAASDSRIAEIQNQQQRATKQLVKPVLKSYPTLGVGSTIILSSGMTGWSLTKLPAVQSFFSATFGHALPTSAIGQSATHNRLGYDHRNSVDVGLHPDSAEGRTLISYLQGQGIPFLAFRAAIPGVATGPHIHIGSPSHRL